jgi:hypothetical protein
LIAGCAGDDADGPADGIAPEQRALRAVQDLDALDIEQILVRADGARVIDAVDVDADARIEVEGKVVLADTADLGREHRI